MEQFSICSSDSIWEDEERRNEYIESKLNGNRNVDGSPQAIFFNSLIRFDQNGYANPKYNNNDNKIDKNEHLSPSNTDTKSDGTHYSNDRCYQVRNNFPFMCHT